MLQVERSNGGVECFGNRPIRDPKHMVVAFEGAFNDSQRGDAGLGS